MKLKEIMRESLGTILIYCGVDLSDNLSGRDPNLTIESGNMELLSDRILEANILSIEARSSKLVIRIFEEF